jgi:hypothetical protein
MECFGVDEIIIFEPKAKKHLPFFSYTAKQKEKTPSLLFVHSEAKKLLLFFSLPKHGL